MDGGDARVLELARDAGLAEEALLGDGEIDARGEQAGHVERFEGDLAADGGVEGEPDDTLAAGAELPTDLVPAGLLEVDGRAREVAVDRGAAAAGAAAVAFGARRGRRGEGLAVSDEGGIAVVWSVGRVRAGERAAGGGEGGFAVGVAAAARGRAGSGHASDGSDGGVLRGGWVWPLGLLHGAAGSYRIDNAVSSRARSRPPAWTGGSYRLETSTNGSTCCGPRR